MPPEPWKLNARHRGHHTRRRHPDYGLRVVSSGGREFWQIVFKVLDGGGLERRLTASFPLIAPERARVVRDALRARITDGEIRSMADWRGTRRSAREVMFQLGWLRRPRSHMKKTIP